MEDTIKSIMIVFDQKEDTLNNFKKDIDEFLINFFKSKNINIHKYESRVKGREEAKLKIVRKGYREFNEFTDLIGVRIICRYEEEIKLIMVTLENLFSIDEENSHDFAGVGIKESDPKKFGYSSIHYVVTLNEALHGVTHYPDLKKYQGLKLEIQVRTILQHAWAEHSRSLMYTKEEEMPVRFQRSFARTAAAIESLELDFKALKNDIDKYNIELSDILNNNENLQLDDSTVHIIMTNGSVIQETEKIIANNVNGGILYERYIDLEHKDYRGLADFIKNEIGVNTVHDFIKIYKTYKLEIIALASEIYPTNGPHAHELWEGASLGFLSFIVKYKNGKFTHSRLQRQIERALRLL